VREVAQASGDVVDKPRFRVVVAVEVPVVEGSGRDASGVVVVEVMLVVVVDGGGLKTIDTGNLFFSLSTSLNAIIPVSVAVEFPLFLPKKLRSSSPQSPSSADEAYSPRLFLLIKFPENLPMLLTTSNVRLNRCLGIRANCTPQVIKSEQPSIIPNPPIHKRDCRITDCGVLLLMSRFTRPVDSKRISVIVSEG